MAFDRFNDKPRRGNTFERRDSDRFSERRSERFGERDGRDGARFGDRFGEGREERREPRRFGDRPFSDRPFSDRPFGKRPERGGFRKFGGHRNTEAAFGTMSGARAKALEQRRYSDHAAFAQTATVRLDADVARVFKDAQSVNAALRAAIALGAIVQAAKPAAEPEKAQAPETAQTEEQTEATPESAAAEEASAE